MASLAAGRDTRPAGARSAVPQLQCPSRWTRSSFLLVDLRDAAGANGAAAFADGEAQALFHGDRGDQLDVHLGVVARHHHLGALGQLDLAGDVGGAEVELRAVVAEERGVAPTLFLGE